jgi:hypothetical protein
VTDHRLGITSKNHFLLVVIAEIIYAPLIYIQLYHYIPKNIHDMILLYFKNFHFNISLGQRIAVSINEILHIPLI